MKPVFEINPEAIFFLETNLICEINPDGFACVFENSRTRKFHGLFFYQFSSSDIPRQLKQVFNEQPLLNKHYKKVCISWAGEESALLPDELYRPGENETLMNTLFGDMEEVSVATDLVADKKLYNVYRMPASIHKVLLDQFPLATFSHQFSLVIKNEKVSNAARLIFYNTGFTVSVVKAGDLRIIHSYPYHSATDVVYHLKNIFSSLGIGNIPVIAGGMIDREGDLFKELSHYFTLNTDVLPEGYEYSEGLNSLPAHYFSQLFSFALCV